MTYFMFLGIFLGLPIILLAWLNRRDRQLGHTQPEALKSWPPIRVIAVLCLMAFVYSTPWDNYLVATRVWWYDETQVTGILMGYVPIEEYTFFILLPIFTGLLLVWFQKRLGFDAHEANNPRLRMWVTAAVFTLWVTATITLVLTLTESRCKPLTYLSLELSWALIPITIQLAFGADILWRHRRTVFLAIVVSTFYLSATDAFAISDGIWVIDPTQSLQWFIGGILPIEEFVFFGIVSTLVVIGITLFLAEESHKRVQALGRYTVLRPLVNRTKFLSEKASDEKGQASV